MSLDENDLQVQEDLADLVADQDEGDRVSNMTHEQALAELAKVRRESAARRVKNRETEAALAELQKYKDEEKTELERLTERAAKAEESLKSLTYEKLVREVAQEAGLAPELAEFLKGSTREELAASAEVLASKTKNTATDLGQGRRGEPVRTQTSPSEAFRALFN